MVMADSMSVALAAASVIVAMAIGIWQMRNSSIPAQYGLINSAIAEIRAALQNGSDDADENESDDDSDDTDFFLNPLEVYASAVNSRRISNSRCREIMEEDLAEVYEDHVLHCEERRKKFRELTELTAS